jgi:hypothetical protein
MGRSFTLTIIATVTIANLAGCTLHPTPPPPTTAPALAPPSPPPYLSDVLRLGMTHDEAMDALQIDEPIHRAATIGDLIVRSWAYVSPRFPGLSFSLQEEPSVRGGWIVTHWTVHPFSAQPARPGGSGG